MNNKLFECFKSKDSTQLESFDILDKKNYTTNIIDYLIEHPFIDTLTYNFDNKNTKFIIYRLNYYNDYYYIEYLLNNYHSINNETIINEYLNTLNGRKIIKGNLKLNNINYTIVQLRDNIEHNNWVTLYDIVVNNTYYQYHIDDSIIEFFITYNRIDNLFIKDKLCLKPIILYSNIHEKYRNYIKKYNSIQYCQNKHDNILINLNKYNDNDNVRSICFIHEQLLNGSLKDKDFIIERKENVNYWLFKNEKKIISYIK